MWIKTIKYQWMNISVFNVYIIIYMFALNFQFQSRHLFLLGDLFPGVEPDEEPNFVISEKEQFKTYRDKDGDGFLDIGEVSVFFGEFFCLIVFFDK